MTISNLSKDTASIVISYTQDADHAIELMEIYGMLTRDVDGTLSTTSCRMLLSGTSASKAARVLQEVLIKGGDPIDLREEALGALYYNANDMEIMRGNYCLMHNLESPCRNSRACAFLKREGNPAALMIREAVLKAFKTIVDRNLSDSVYDISTLRFMVQRRELTTALQYATEQNRTEVCEAIENSLEVGP